MEQQILLSAVQAYADVVRDLTVVKLRENNVKVLSEQLKAEENRFKVGEVTKTDVAQSTASLSGGQSDLAWRGPTFRSAGRITSGSSATRRAGSPMLGPSTACCRVLSRPP